MCLAHKDSSFNYRDNRKFLDTTVHYKIITQLGTGGCTQKAQPVRGVNPKP